MKSRKTGKWLLWNVNLWKETNRKKSIKKGNLMETRKIEKYTYEG